MLNPRHVLITGASGGIGAALAACYAAPGVRLSLHGRDSGRLTVVAATAERKGADVSIKAGDVRDAAEMAGWIAECGQRQPLDLIIANAGILAGIGGDQETPEEARAVFDTNLTGVLNTLHPAIPLMIARGRGQIAVMSSLASFGGSARAPAYGASKAAARIYAESLRDGLAARGVEVTVICPGFVKTPMTEANRRPMPFIVTADRAAEIIRAGLTNGRARVVFPWRMYVLVRLVGALPRGLVSLLREFRDRPRPGKSARSSGN